MTKKTTNTPRKVKPLGYIIVMQGSKGPAWEPWDQILGSSDAVMLCRTPDDALRLAYSEDLLPSSYEIVPVYMKAVAA